MKLVAKKSNPLLQVLLQEGGYATTSKAREIIKNGAVWVNNQVIKIPSTMVEAGTSIEINAKKSKQEADHAKYAFKVLFEDDFLIAVAKPPRISVEKSPGEKLCFKDVVLHAMQEEKNALNSLAPLTAIETNATGVLLFAKNQRTAIALQAKSAITKRWTALVEGKVHDSETVLKFPMLKLKTGKWVAVEKPVSGSLEAETTVRLKKHAGNFSLLELRSDTSIPKQFQAQLMLWGHPVAGDKRYGASISFSSRIGLHLSSIGFIHPVSKQQVIIDSPLPQSFTRAGRYL
ncbi:MAG TPA: S4 domain-containing protein [Luteibaculaceae bacterium]|nr:S4 domain-containing protein [Luteibaculaceae bacterium]